MPLFARAPSTIAPSERTVGEEEAARLAAEEKECVVCWAGYEVGASVCELRCAHIFHRACIQKWMAVKRLCPLCRTAF